jgi:hypothetical protein
LRDDYDMEELSVWGGIAVIVGTIVIGLTGGGVILALYRLMSRFFGIF